MRLLPKWPLQGTVLGLVQQQGINSMDPLGVFTPAVFQSTPSDQVEISAELTADHTPFLCHDDGRLHRFGRELFLIDGSFPGPAH